MIVAYNDVTHAQRDFVNKALFTYGSVQPISLETLMHTCFYCVSINFCRLLCLKESVPFPEFQTSRMNLILFKGSH
jgi:hypothetical protein